MDILAFSLASVWASWILPILMFVIGLGAVVFVHELGHFIAAKAVGIKVERFAIGMGPRIAGFKRGETDYCLCAFPVGGYIKMLGQEDFAALKDVSPDPRAYTSKPVWARMVVISAGVVMNAIFAALLVIIIGLVGMKFPLAMIGYVVPDSPAAKAQIAWQNPPAGAPAQTVGFEPGDVITEIDGRSTQLRFTRIQVAAVLAHSGETFKMKVSRQRDGREIAGLADVVVKENPQTNRLEFGLGMSYSLTQSDSDGSLYDTPLKPGDKVVEVAGRQVQHFWEIESALDGVPAGLVQASIPVVVQRQGQRVALDLPTSVGLSGVAYVSGQWRQVVGAAMDDEKKTTTLVFPDGHDETFHKDQVTLSSDVMLAMLGMVPRMQVIAVIDGSPAYDAGMKPGDVVVSYADSRDVTYRKLMDLNAQFAGQRTSIVIERDGKQEQKQIRPSKRADKVLLGLNQGMNLGSPVIGAVLSDSPAGREGVQPGDRIVEVAAYELEPAASQPASSSMPAMAAASASATTSPSATSPAQVRKVNNWIDLYNALCDFRGKQVVVCLASGRAVTISCLDDRQFNPADYKLAPANMLPFELEMTHIEFGNPLKAVAWGLEETKYFILTTYGTLRGLFQGTVSRKELAGPVGIGSMAIQMSRRGFMDFVYLMALISASLAVINFLPFPVLDGGHATFLIIEKLRGKPVSLKVQNITQLIGLATFLFIFVALTWNDIVRILKNMWL